MDIVIGRTAYINRDGAQKDEPSRTVNKKKKEDRRKNKRDRRKDVRDGVIVTLSTKKDRRVQKDRRKNSPDRY
jgi:hypothetical protein